MENESDFIKAAYLLFVMGAPIVLFGSMFCDLILEKIEAKRKWPLWVT